MTLLIKLSKQLGDFFQILWPSYNVLTLTGQELFLAVFYSKPALGLGSNYHFLFVQIEAIRDISLRALLDSFKSF